MKMLALIPLLSLVTGCAYPARIVMPLETRVVDAETGAPIEEATVLRVVCDIHDFKCTHGYVDRAETNHDGKIQLRGRREWGLWIPAPGGLPVPNHQIAIWKAGYEAFVFSQYGDISHIQSSTDRADLRTALQEIPQARKNYSPRDHPEKLFEDGRVELRKLGTHNSPLEPTR